MGIKLAKYLRQDCLYWTKTGQTTAGTPTYAANPVAMKCRWEDGTELVVTTDGRSIICNAKVMLMVAVKAGDLLFLGTLADWRRLKSYPKPPTKDEGGWQVITHQHIPDRKGRDFFHQAIL